MDPLDLVKLAPTASQTLYTTATRALFFNVFPDAIINDLERRADGSTPVAGARFDPDEFAAQGVRIRPERIRMSARLIWAGNPVSGFGVRLVTPFWPPWLLLERSANIVVEFATPQRAVGFDYPGNVQAIWKGRDGAVILDTGNVPGSGTNFLGLGADQPIRSLTLARSSFNQISGLAFSAWK